ncbi:sterol 3-beta-glucosyltransferase UGT80B1 isoform X2 [Malania oleifera]|uniref:sterol 3-beta-glucosyltransferase UGT80B1 isoform X2 n=1 Tax=Malania oleifera TaxID=397392 RepID=UPI0025AE416D|nr:sterol 3-beta-glucosyltransferase UGT80B1 isoform X2 [Malania oleifera]
MEKTTERTNPTAVFMAFGTKGDVYPIAAVAVAFACNQKQYSVVLITHAAHENLSTHLVQKNVAYFPISSPPVLSPQEGCDAAGSLEFSVKKRTILTEHRRECFSIIEQIFRHGLSVEGDFIAINFFALEGWSLAELFCVRCIIAAPYVVPYSAPSSFERCFKRKLPRLYEYFQEAPVNKDPVTGLPAWHDRSPSPLLLYGFSKEVVECPDYWPPNIRVCGFWFLPIEWQFSCRKCGEIAALTSSRKLNTKDDMCSSHARLHSFLRSTVPMPPIFIGLSSIGSMGFLKNPLAFLRVLQTVLEITSYRFILFSSGYEPLHAAIHVVAAETSVSIQCGEDEMSLFGGRLFSFSGTIPYNWLFPRCLAAIHHGGSGSTAAALHAGIPQIICPFMLDQFYWAERMFWLGVAPEPLKRDHLLPDKMDEKSISEAAYLLSKAINYALSPDVKGRASEMAEIISLEDGIEEAVNILKEEVCRSSSDSR